MGTRLALRLSAGAAALMLAACGGGGGAVQSPGSAPPTGSLPAPTPSPSPAPAPTPTPSPTPTPAPTSTRPFAPADQVAQRSASDDAEYRRRYASNEYVHALFALDGGWTGKGVTVGVIDDGIDAANPEFAGRVSPLSKDFGGTITRDTGGVQSRTARDSVDNSGSRHGTAIAGIIAAARDGSGVMGIAPDARLAALRVDDATPDGVSYPTSSSVRALAHARDSGIEVVSRSLVTSGLDATLQRAVETYAAAGGLLVNSAGNAGGAEPVDAVNVTSANRAGWLFVGAINTTGTDVRIASYSNRAGSLADRFVVAPGDNVTVLAGGGGATTAVSGTSMATPVVAGVVATILSKWPHLSGVDAGRIVLDTARDAGDPGTDATYGRGLVDARAALSPVDPSLTGSVQTALAGSALVLPAAVGGNGVRAALGDVTVLDRYGRDFRVSVAGAVGEVGGDLRVGGLVQQLATARSSEVATDAVQATTTHLVATGWTPSDRPRAALAGVSVRTKLGRVGLTGGWRGATTQVAAGAMGLAPAADTLLAYAPQAAASISADLAVAGGQLTATAVIGGDRVSRADGIAVGWRGRSGGVRLVAVEERGAVFGAPALGALALGRGAASMAVEVDRRLTFGAGWLATAHGSLGATRLADTPASVVTRSSALLTTRFGLSLDGPAGPGRVTFGLDQPLLVERGSATLRLGSGYDLSSRSLVFADREVPLAGTRRLQLSTGYALATSAGPLRLAALHDAALGRTGALLSFSSNW